MINSISYQFLQQVLTDCRNQGTSANSHHYNNYYNYYNYNNYNYSQQRQQLTPPTTTNNYYNQQPLQQLQQPTTITIATTTNNYYNQQPPYANCRIVERFPPIPLADSAVLPLSGYYPLWVLPNGLTAIVDDVNNSRPPIVPDCERKLQLQLVVDIVIGNFYWEVL
eukprot:gene2950-5751_t